MKNVVAIVALLAACLGGAFAGLAYPTSFNQAGLPLVEAKLSDWLMVWRHRFAPHAVAIDPRIQLVGLDEASVAFFAKPDAFWEEDYAAVTRALLDAGASVVALDVIQNVPTGKAPPVVKEYIEKSRDEMFDCLAEDRTIIAEHKQSEQILSWPPRLVQAADGGRNSCLDNLVTDPDGIVRKVPFGTARLDGNSAGAVACGMSARLAELASGQEMKQVSNGWSFQSLRVELEKGDLRINYPGPSGSFPLVSLTALLHKLEHHDSFNEYSGKIVLITPTFLSDIHPSPYMLEDGHQTMGGEIHAAALNTYLTGQYLKRAPGPLWVGLPALTSALVCFVFAVIPSAVALFLATLICTGYLALSFYLFAFKGLLLALASPALGAVFGLGLGLFGRFTTSELARSRAQRILGQMVSPQVAAYVLRSAEEVPMPGGSRQEITVLFSDINQFTPTCEKYQPEQVMSMLNHYFSEMVTIIHAHKGYVKQFVGDEIMAIFGAPEPLDDHPSASVACALEMMKRLAYLETRDPTHENGFYSVKIGINTGFAVCGTVGSKERSEYAAVGDDVNLAARLESLTTSLQVSNLVSPSTKDQCARLPQGWQWRSLGLQKFKGKSVELEVWTMEPVSRH